MTKTITRKRATVKSDGVGTQRHNLYADVLNRINEAIENGFCLEAITLLESIISDRLESLCNEQTCSDKNSFDCLGDLIAEAKKYNISESWIDILKRLKIWKDARNNALHEIAKIEAGDTSSFADKYKPCKSHAKEGKKLFREVDREIRKYRK